MIFQAFRIKSPTPCVSKEDQNLVINSYRFSHVRVPCAPCRSSFSAAFEDVKKARKMGFVAAVRLINLTNQL